MLPPSIICTPQLHLHCIESLRINTVIVLGQDNLYNKLRKKFPDPSPVKVIKLPKSGGSVKKDAACRSASVARCAQSYFGVETPGGEKARPDKKAQAGHDGCSDPVGAPAGPPGVLDSEAWGRSVREFVRGP